MEMYAHEVFDQYNTHSVEEILKYYAAHKDLLARTPRQIKTVGVYYHCMTVGGVEKVISLLIPIWLKEGYKVVLFTEEEPTQDDFLIPKETVRVVLPKDTEGLENHLVAFENALFDNNVDVLIQNEWYNPKIFPQMLIVKRHHLPFVLYTHGQFSVIYRYLNDYALNSHRIFALCDLVLTLSDTNQHFYELNKCHSIVVQNPIEPALRDVMPIVTEADNHNVAWIGRFSSEKRPKDALLVMKRVCEQVPTATLSMVGTGTDDEVSDVKKFCTELGLAEKVNFLGYQSDVSQFYKNAAVVLMTSETEGYPNVVIEAKAYGKILTMYDLPYLTMTKSGLGLRTAEIGDTNELGKQVAEILISPELRKTLEAEAIQSFQEFKEYDQARLWNAIFREMETAASVNEMNEVVNTSDWDDGPMMISLLFKEFMFAYKLGQKAVETYPDFRVGHAVLKLPRMIKHLLKL